MNLSRDMRELIEYFEKQGVQYLLVGGYAVNYYGYSRMTQDIDFLVMPSSENMQRLMRAMADFGFGGANIPWEYFEREGTAVHLGVEPNRIDLLTSLQGVSNAELIKNANRIEFEGVHLSIIAYEDLIAVK